MTKGFIVYPTYKVEGNKAYVYLFGRLENGESFLSKTYFRPYFYIKSEDAKKVEQLIGIKPEETDFHDFDGNKVSKVIMDIPRDVGNARKLLQEQHVVCYEADIRFAYRFLIDHDLKGSVALEGDYTKGEYVDRIYLDPEIKSAYWQPNLKILSIDIETNRNAQELYSIALYSEDFQKVLIVKGDKKHYSCAESFPTEKALLERFTKLVVELDPDIIVGWNVIDFDLAVLKRFCDRHRVQFVFGRVDWPCTLRITDSFFLDSKAAVPGRVVLDGIHLMKMSFVKLDDYKLETAAKHFLGEGKLIEGSHKWEEIENCYLHHPQKLIDYNLHDARITLELIKKSTVLELTIRRSMLTRMQPDRVNASIASLDSLYLKELQKRKIVAPSALSNEREDRIKGGFVMTSKPGIYDNILVLDFKSLYPSIIRTFNIDPFSYVDQKHLGKYRSHDVLESPNKAHFRKQDGILPFIIEDLWKQRDEAKKRKDKLAANAVKILMNSFFGVLANPQCRFYSMAIANAITHFGQFLIKLCAEKIEELGHEVIYGDTDSIFVKTKEKETAKAKKIGIEIQDYINAFYKAYVQKHYGRESFLELEFEKVYRKFLMPTVRHGEEGAKKRYAGLLEKDGREEIDFVGLEFVRRDWTELAKQFQLALLDKIFKEEEVTEYVRSFINDLKAGKYDKLLVYKKAIRKLPEQYTKTTPPHIKAARKLGRTTTGIIEYIMVKEGPEPLELVTGKTAIDYEHYIEKQIRPIADSILGFFGVNFEDLVEGHKQKQLFEY